MRILLVEDDFSLGETLKERLERETLAGKPFEIQWCETYAQAALALSGGAFDLFIFDMGLPDGNGLELAARVRRGDFGSSAAAVPLLFLTAMSSPEVRLQSYEIGASEFIPKPFHLRELLIRIHHVLEHHPTARGSDRVYDLGHGVEFNATAMLIRPSQIRLATKDAELFELIVKSSPNVVSRDEILDRVWGEDRFPSTRTVDNAIVRIRQALGSKVAGGLKSVRSVGYQWIRPTESESSNSN